MIYYSHVNEDSRVERNLLRQSACNTAVVVAGSGERLLALLDLEACRTFHAVDLNPEALYLLQLKLVALKQLDVEAYWQFCGHHPAPAAVRKQQFQLIKSKLTAPCLRYWQKKMSVIEKGILHCGHFERFLQRMRPLIRAFLGKEFELIFSSSGTPPGRFPQKRWNMLQKVFSQSWVYRAAGNRDPAFTGRGAQTALIPDALDQVIRGGEAGACFMAHLIFQGHLRNMEGVATPPSLQKEVLEKIRQRLLQGDLEISFHHGDLLALTQKGSLSPPGPVFYSFSDILSFETSGYLEKLLGYTTGAANLVAWRTFLRNRPDPASIRALAGRYAGLQEHTAQESTRMYQVFSISETLNKSVL